MAAFPTNAPNGVIVNQPAAPPWRYGLYSAATLLPVDDSVRWEVGGVQWSPDTCAQGGLWVGGFCQVPDVPGTWTMAVSGATGVAFTVTQPDPVNTPFIIQVQGPNKGAGKTLVNTTLKYGTGAAVVFPGDQANPQPLRTLQLRPEEAGSLPLVLTYNYTDLTTDTGQVTLTFTGSGPVQQRKTLNGIDWTSATPFVVYTALACQALGFSDASARASLRLSGNEARLVERGFWLGEQGNVPALASAASTPVTPLLASDPGLDLVSALGVLEQMGQAQNDNGAQPWNGGNTQLVIHAPRALAALAASLRLIVPDGAVLRTPLGNVWAFGAGYGFEGPDGKSNAHQAWIYATGPVTIRRSEPFTAEVFSQFINQNTAVAERAVLVTNECVQLAAKVAYQPAPIGG